MCSSWSTTEDINVLCNDFRLPWIRRLSISVRVYPCVSTRSLFQFRLYVHSPESRVLPLTWISLFEISILPTLPQCPREPPFSLHNHRVCDIFHTHTNFRHVHKHAIPFNITSSSTVNKYLSFFFLCRLPLCPLYTDILYRSSLHCSHFPIRRNKHWNLR